MIPTFDELVHWARHELQLLGLGPTTAELVKERAWGMVVKVETSQDRCYFAKANCDGLAAEAALVRLLSEVVPQQVVAVIATREELGWVLLANGGPVLGEDFTAKQWRNALAEYAELQRAMEPHVDRMLDIGVLDARAQTLLGRWDNLVAHPGLCIGRPGGTTVEELEQLRDVGPRFQEWADELAEARVPSTIQHDDVHPWNVFRADDRIFDWGDASVAHPFASLLMALQFTRQWADDDPEQLESIQFLNSSLEEFRGLSDAYLSVWSDLAPLEDLRREATLALRLAPIGRALNWARVPGSGDNFDPPRMADWVRRIIATAAIEI